jgi:hypothetical protein
MNQLLSALAGAVVLGIPLLAPGQATSAPDAAATSPYRSAFTGYKPWRDTPPGDWKALNHTVQGHGMSMAMPMSPGSAASMPTRAASAPEHAGHDMHGGHR